MLIKPMNILVLFLVSLSLLTSCKVVPISYRLGMDESVVVDNPLKEELLKRIYEMYRNIEEKNWGKLYDMISKVDGMMARSEAIEYFSDMTVYGRNRWEFKSLTIKQLIVNDNKAYVKMEYSIRDFTERKTHPPEYWYDEWVYSDNEWMITSFFYNGYRPDYWPDE